MSNQEEIINKYTNMGFDFDLIAQAYQKTGGKDDQMLDTLFQLTEQNTKMIENSVPYAPVNQGGLGTSEDIDMNKAIELSLKEQKNNPTYEPLNPEQRLRKPGMPIGLKNIGNTCYVNSLFQTYFQSQQFVRAILEFDPEVKLPEEQKSSAPVAPGDKDIKKERMKSSIKLITSLQKLFAMMIRSHKKYVDPTDVLNTVVDDLGERIPVGDQKDVTEYHLNFLSRIEEGLFFQEKFKKAVQGGEGQENNNLMQIEDGPEGFMSLTALKHQSSHAENSLVSGLFFGLMKQFRTFLQDGGNVVQDEESLFGPIILDITHKELYSSIEHYCNFTIDEFRAPNGQITKAEGSMWIERPPEFLFFQLQRVVFDKESGALKINDKFQFEKEIYLDRFMLQNREEAIQINKTIESLRRKLALQETSLEKMSNYMNSNLDIIAVLSIASDFLKNQMDLNMSSSQDLNYDPTIVGQLDGKEKILTSLDTLGKYKSSLQNKMDELKISIENIKKQIHELNSKLNKHKYHLVSILIHDGVAGSGHYYSFNRTVETDSWKRFNDIQVVDEKEEVVFKEALGGYANISAYCLVYLSDASIQAELETRKSGVDNIDSKDIEIERKHYAKFLTPKLIEDVEADNIVFHEEIEEHKFNSYLKSIAEVYKNRYDKIAEALKSKTNKSPPIEINTFGSFLKNDPSFEGLFKWYVLDLALRDSQIKMKLQDLKQSPRLLKILESRLSSIGKPHSIDHLVLKPEEEAKLNNKINEYASEFKTFIITKFLLNAYLKENWLDACFATKTLLEIVKDQSSYFIKLLRNMSKVNVLKLALNIEKDIKSQQIPQALELMNFLIALIKSSLKPEDPQTAQVRMILNDALAEAKDKVSEEDYNKLKQEVYRFGTALHVAAELDKVVKDYKPKEIEDEIAQYQNQDNYSWKEIDENAPANQIQNLFKEFNSKAEMFINFHNLLSNTKSAIKLDDRKKGNFILE